MEVYKIFVEQNSLKPRIKVRIPMYEHIEATIYEKCGKVIAEPKELIKFEKNARLKV